MTDACSKNVVEGRSKGHSSSVNVQLCFFTNRPNNISSTFGDIFVTQRAELLSYGLYLSIVATKTKHTATISTILTLSACRKVINA